MKALSLWQPWATLVDIGAKTIETRSWAPAYRGDVAIHAAAHWSRDLALRCTQEPFASALREAGFQVHPVPVCGPVPTFGLPFSALLCVVRISVVVDADPLNLSDRERAFGVYGPGRHALFLDDRRRFSSPIPFAGRQGLFPLPESLVKQYPLHAPRRQ